MFGSQSESFAELRGRGYHTIDRMRDKIPASILLLGEVMTSYERGTSLGVYMISLGKLRGFEPEKLYMVSSLFFT